MSISHKVQISLYFSSKSNSIMIDPSMISRVDPGTPFKVKGLVIFREGSLIVRSGSIITDPF